MQGSLRELYKGYFVRRPRGAERLGEFSCSQMSQTIRVTTAVIIVLAGVVVVVVVGAPPLPTMLVDISTIRALGEGEGGGRGRIIAYKPTSTSQLPPNLMPSFKFYN